MLGNDHLSRPVRGIFYYEYQFTSKSISYSLFTALSYPPGGLIAISMREAYIEDYDGYKEKWYPLWKQLSDGNFCRKIEVMGNIDKYYQDHQGIVFVYQKC